MPIDINRELFKHLWQGLMGEKDSDTSREEEEAWKRFKAERLPQIVAAHPAGSAPVEEVLRSRFDDFFHWFVEKLCDEILAKDIAAGKVVTTKEAAWLRDIFRQPLPPRRP